MDDNRSIEISVIIPTYNRKSALRECIFSLLGQDYPKEKYEIIVVDDGSSDETAVMMADLSQKYPNLRYLQMPHQGPAASRNAGIKQSHGEIIAFTDNDCIPAVDWIKNILASQSLHKDVLVIGGLTEVSPHNIKAVVSQSLSSGAMSTEINNKTEHIFFPTCNVSFKKRYLKEEFNELFPLPAGEDLEFFWRLFKAGNKFVYDEKIRVFHNCHDKLKSFLRQAYMYGRGNYLVKYIHQDHPLLKEIKTRNLSYFLVGLVINFIKIPRFSYLLGKRLISSFNQFSLYEKYQIFVYFSLHKINYLFGNILEYSRSKRVVNNSGLKKNYSKPEFIILDITHRCNLKCNICQIRKDKQIKEFSLSEIKSIIDQAIDWGVKEFVLSGGEPLIRHDIFEVLDYVKEKRYHVGILSNGIILDEKFINKLLPYMVSDSLSLSISLDALTPKIHDDIRGSSGSFERTVNALQIISRLKTVYLNLNFNVISIVLNENLEELVGLADFLRSLNVNSIQFQPLLSNNLIMKEREQGVKYWVPPHRLALLDETIDKLIVFKRNNPALVRNTESNLTLIKRYFRDGLNQGDVKCLHGARTMLIANNGDATTCFRDYGNVRHNTLRQIFESKEADQAREKVISCKKPCLLPCFTDY
jgi:MoaA/NifB/PqqE/SkfB family radical SAM enzyme/glycosyltransferase involved in cell wall biosynthesis